MDPQKIELKPANSSVFKTPHYADQGFGTLNFCGRGCCRGNVGDTEAHSNQFGPEDGLRTCDFNESIVQLWRSRRYQRSYYILGA